jgi:hypothetical protein
MEGKAMGCHCEGTSLLQRKQTCMWMYAYIVLARYKFPRPIFRLIDLKEHNPNPGLASDVGQAYSIHVLCTT